MGRISPHALRKINKQYKILKAARAEQPLKPCTKVFTTTMGLPCAHIIKARIEKIGGDLGGLHLDDVHPHWRFKKPDTGRRPGRWFNHLDCVEVIQPAAENVDEDENVDENDVESMSGTPPPFEEVLRDHQARQAIAQQAVNEEVNNEANNDVNGEVNNHMESASADEDSDDELNQDLEHVKSILDINEPMKVKAKGRQVGAKQKKPVMTRKEKAAARSTKRDPSGFEHVQKTIAQREKAAIKKINEDAKKAKQVAKEDAAKAKEEAKEAAAKAKKEAKEVKEASRSSRARGRGGRGRGGGGRGGRGGAAPVTKPKAAEEPIEVSSDSESSEDEERDAGPRGSDEDFHESKHGDGDDRDEWMYD